MMEDVDWVKILILMAVLAVGMWIYFRRFGRFKKIRRCEECGRILHDDEQSSDILPRLKFVGFLTLTEHSSRALVRGISAPFVHIFVYVRSIIVKVLCLNATLPPYDQVSYKETKRICSTNSSVHITNILIVFKLFKRIDQTYVFGAIHPQPKGRGFLAPGS